MAYASAYACLVFFAENERQVGTERIVSQRCNDGKCHHQLCGQKCSTGCACNAPCVSRNPTDKWAQKVMCPLKCGFKRAQKAKCHGACWKKCSPLCPCNLPLG